MSTYSDHEQRLLDQQSGAELDRQAQRREMRTSNEQACPHPTLYARDMFGQPQAWGSCLLCERDRLLRQLALSEELEKAMADCIGVEDGQTFEQRAEELIVIEVAYQNEHGTTAVLSERPTDETRDEYGRETLEPCPFCANEAKIENAAEVGPNAYVVCCQNPMCMSSSKVIVAEKDNVDHLLIEAWNRRSRSIERSYAESSEKTTPAREDTP